MEQGGDDGIDRGWVELFGEHGGHLVAMDNELVEHGACGGEQVQSPDAAVLRVGPTLDEISGGEPVYQTCDGDRFDFEKFGKFFLRQAGLTIESNEHDPLRSGHTVGTCAPVGFGPKHSADIVKQNEKIGGEMIHSDIISRLMMNASGDFRPT